MAMRGLSRFDCHPHQSNKHLCPSAVHSTADVPLEKHLLMATLQNYLEANRPRRSSSTVEMYTNGRMRTFPIFDLSIVRAEDIDVVIV